MLPNITKQMVIQLNFLTGSPKFCKLKFEILQNHRDVRILFKDARLGAEMGNFKKKAGGTYEQTIQKGIGGKPW